MIFSILLLVIAVLIGTGLAYWFGRSEKLNIKMILTFSGAYLLGIGVFHLLPEVFEGHSHHYGLFIMAGFFTQLLLEAYSKGLEHGHTHQELFQGKGLPMGVMLSLFLHAFLESMPVGSDADPLSREALMWGLFVHKIPVSLILFTMLRLYTRSAMRLFLWMLLFAAMAPLGVWIGGEWSLLSRYSAELTAFVFGIFLHISTTILFESSDSHRLNIYKYGLILIGLLIAWLSVSH